MSTSEWSTTSNTPKKEEIFQDIKILTSPKPDVIACRKFLLKLQTMLNRGTELTEEEGNTVFFGLTFLFRETNPVLKKIIYLTLQELIHQTSFYMITSSLLKDAKDKNEINKIDAFKLLPYVISQNNPVQSEQLFKGAIFDKNISVANSAIMASNRISVHDPDHIRKCVNDIQDLLLSKPSACHYHAINVLYNIKKQDMMSFVKIMLLIISKNSSYGILATIQLIRYSKEILESDLLDSNSEKAVFMWLAKQLNKNNTIVIEVSKTLVSMKNVSNSDLIAAVSSLNIYLLSMNPINVFAALKIYDKLVDQPSKASLLTSTTDIEAHLTNNNKAVKSLSLSILLKVCREDKVVELLDKAYEIFTEMPDSVKYNVLNAAEDISRKYPEKTKDIIYFLWRCLRDRGELDFKVRAIKKITGLMKKKTEYYDKVFEFFCEYIEDPFSPKLVHIILNVFVENVRFCSEPRKILRFVLNRLHLDEGKTRSAAISCLGEIGIQVGSIREECLSIISSYVRDIDDEVRERANYYKRLLEQERLQIESFTNEAFSQEDLISIQAAIRDAIEGKGDLDLERIVCTKAESRLSGSVAIASDQKTTRSTINPKSGVIPNYSESVLDKAFQIFASADEDLKEYGELFISRPAIELSHKDSDFYVRMVKHIFEEHIVLEYIIANQDEQHVRKDNVGYPISYCQQQDRQGRHAGVSLDREHKDRKRRRRPSVRFGSEEP